MRITQSNFVLSLEVPSPVVVSIPHEGLRGHDLNAYFDERSWGIRGSERYLSAIVNDMNRGGAVASVVRGLLPRSLCDYNRPLQKGRDPAIADRRLIPSWNAYHRELKRLTTNALRFGKRSILVDLHGFMGERSGLPHDLVLGSCGGTTTPCGLDKRARDFFEKAGYDAKLSGLRERFSGGFIVSRYGKGDVSAIQIEISNRLRRDDSASEGKRLAEVLRKLVLTLRD